MLYTCHVELRHFYSIYTRSQKVSYDGLWVQHRQCGWNKDTNICLFISLSRWITSVCFILFLRHICVFLSWDLLYRLKIRFVDIQASRNPEHSGQKQLRERQSLPKHDPFQLEIPMETLEDPKNRSKMM